MTKGRTAKCAHENCSCQVAPGGAFGDYCSDYCRDASKITELRCECGHPSCG
jgi:hypothetical protein